MRTTKLLAMNLTIYFHLMFEGSKVISLNDIVKEYHPQSDDVNYEFLTQDQDNVTIPLSDSEYLFNHPKFRMNWNVVLFVAGWNLNVTDETITALYNAYRCRGGYNFVVRTRLTTWNFGTNIGVSRS